MRRVNEIVSSDIGNYLSNKATWDIFVNVKSYGAKGDGVTDDTAAITKALAAGPYVIFPEGTYIISDSISITSGKQVMGVGPKTIIRQVTDNIPIFYMSGERVHLSGMKLEFANRQADPNKWGNAIHIRKLYESVIERLYINKAAHGIYCERYTLSDVDATANYIYSCSIRDIRVTAFSYYAYYLSSINAGNTGCVFENLYCVNWNNFDLQTKHTSKGYYFFKTFSESFAAQLNAEWGVITESVYNFNTCDTFFLSSPHIEGVDSSTNFKSIFEASGGSDVLVSSGAMLNCKITASTQFALVKLSTSGTTFELNGFVERVGTQGSYTTPSLPPFLGDSGMQNGDMTFKNCKFNNFISTSTAPSVFPPIMKRFNNEIYYHTVGGRAIYYGSTTPTIGKWAVGDRIINTSTSLGSNAGWVCTQGGLFSPPASSVTTTIPTAFVMDIIVSSQGSFVVGDTITVVGSSRVFVITNIYTSGGNVHFALSINIEVTVTNATVQYATPVFTRFEQAGAATSISSTPTFIGQFAVSGGLGYMATGTTSSADWKQITN